MNQNFLCGHGYFLQGKIRKRKIGSFFGALVIARMTEKKCLG
jgi:hypothetical protein